MEAEFVFEKETKRTFRFQEVGDNPSIGTLYIQKTALNNEQPKRIKVTVTVVE